MTEPNFQLNTGTALTICDGQPANLTATSLDGAAPVIYEWTNTINGAVTIGNTINPTPNSNVNLPVVAIDANGCLTTPTIVAISVNPTPIAAFTQDINEGCQPLCVTFSAITTLPNSNWQWDFGDVQNSNWAKSSKLF